jgi:hypothetical protein
MVLDFHQSYASRCQQCPPFLRPQLAWHSWAPEIRLGLVPIHSLLLRESQLVSFPPLNYMLKLSGSGNSPTPSGAQKHDSIETSMAN